jgi:hypothetical protein
MSVRYPSFQLAFSLLSHEAIPSIALYKGLR